MAVDRAANLLDKLTALTGDLRPAPDTAPDQLAQALAAVAQALAAGQAQPLTRAAPVVPALNRSAIAAAHLANLKAAAAAAAAAPPVDAASFLVARRDVPLASTLVPGLAPDWTLGRAIDTSFGPFLDPLGRPVWIDLFRIVRQFDFVRSPGAAPFLTVPLQGIPFASDKFALVGGSVWIDARQIAGAAPVGGYTGLRIKSGTLTLNQKLVPSGREIVVPASVTCTLTLKLDPGAPPAGAGPGQDARLASVEPPKTVVFVFHAAGAKLGAAVPARVQVYGSSVAVDVTVQPPIYDAISRRILVPATTATPAFTAADVRSATFMPSGSAPVTGAAWTLPVTIANATTLGQASGAGGLALALADGLALAWRGQATPVPPGPVALFVDPGLISLGASAARGTGLRVTVPLWSPAPGRPPASRVDLQWAPNFPLSYFGSAAGSEVLLTFGDVRGNFDRPVTVAGKRVFVHAKQALVVLVDSALFQGLIIEAAPLETPPAPARALGLAIANAVFRTTPALGLLLVATYDGKSAATGGLALGFGLQYLLPILPDPYAANVALPYYAVREAQNLGLLDALVFWTPATVPVLTYTLPASAPAATLATVQAGVQSAGGAPTNIVIPTPGHGPVLLDLSTQADQFGVGWFGATDVAGAASAAATLAVDAMYLAGPGRSVAVLTLPAVQWEPVYTETQLPPPNPVFPTPAWFTDQGGMTSIVVETAALVRVAPAPALDFIVDNFTTSPSPQTAVARLTLPFGIEAQASLVKSDATGSRGAAVAYNRPQFTADALTGAHQIAVRAVDPSAPDSPSLQGWAFQRTDNLAWSAGPVGSSVLGPDVDAIFNGYLGPATGIAQQVPVTRFDLSGYGESVFSDWRDTTAAPVAVGQARFDVVVGRTALEVVQVRSILYPYHVRVVRTITIQRKNSGCIVRKDSGWQAASDGDYLFNSPVLTVHPGIVRGISGVQNIRDTGQTIVAGGVELAAVLFDGNLAVENTVKGATPAGVPARNQIGYVQLTPEKDGGLTPAQYAELIQKAGPMGGPIDAQIDVGASGQLMKLGRVGVGVTQNMGSPEFVMAAWGSPQFGPGGQWSFLRQTAVGVAPEVVDKDLGVPLVRMGPAGVAPPATSPYRFADPQDLGSPDTPAADYGIVHATGTQRVFFPRPIIEAGADRITSHRAPVLADPYSLATAVGFFPRIDAAIAFPDANYALVVNAGQHRLQLPSPSFPITVGQRTIAEAAGVRTYVDYSGAVAELTIDTAAAVPWTFKLHDVSVAASAGALGEVMRVTATVDAAANAATQLAGPALAFGNALGMVQNIMTFLQQLGIPMPLSVAMTNKLQIKAGLKIPMDDELNKLMPPGGPSFDDTDVVVSFVVSPPAAEVDFELGATILIPTPFDPLMAVGSLKVEIKLSTDAGTSLALTTGAGVGVAFNVAGFGCKAYFLETMFLIAGDSVYGFGVGVLVKGSVDLVVVSVDVSVEAKMAVLAVTPGAGCPSTTIYGAAQLTFALEVTICWVIDIDIEAQTEADQNLNGGPCPLPDVL